VIHDSTIPHSDSAAKEQVQETGAQTRDENGPWALWTTGVVRASWHFGRPSLLDGRDGL
jgi:hypothetical protein